MACQTHCYTTLFETIGTPPHSVTETNLDMSGPTRFTDSSREPFPRLVISPVAIDGSHNPCAAGPQEKGRRPRQLRESCHGQPVRVGPSARPSGKTMAGPNKRQSGG